MSKRLQVLLDDTEWREIQRAARARRSTIAEWVRQALHTARRLEPGRNAGTKLAVVRGAARHNFPVADVDQMLDQIERGYVER